MDIHELISLCKNTENKIFVQTHNFPDADAIASAYALGEIFSHFNISPLFCCAGKVDRLSTEKLADLLDIELYQEEELDSVMSEKDYIICVDSQKHAGNIDDFIGEEVACIDHHPTFKNIDYKWSQVEIVGACSTLLAEHFKELNLVPSEKCATALLYGIKKDTMDFTRGVTQRDIAAFSFLFDLVNSDELSKLEHTHIVSKDLLAYTSAIENIHLYGDIGFSKIPFSCPDGLVGGLSDFILSIEEVNVAIVYCMRENGIKFSVRSLSSSVNAGKMINLALKDIGSGGGHSSMAGGFIPIGSFGALSPYMDNSIENLFISVIREMK
ncbi:MAG: bifunctional oligoribonuclease/PAP phosphatase NrnA [Ruminiclostridium sp.]